jgi:hypothetical protein
MRQPDRYDAMGFDRRTADAMAKAQLAATTERLRLADEEKASNRAAWNRLCGMASPIGHGVDLPH